MAPLEIELKFYIPDPDDLVSRLAVHNARCTGGRTFEYNVRYETADESLLRRRCLLRLRQDRTTTLTYKAPPAQSDDRFKVYRELEVSVSDFATMDAILAALGFSRRQVYEKRRLGFDDLTFDNFEGVPIRFEDYRYLFETETPRP